jgi:hypothetical protein
MARKGGKTQATIANAASSREEMISLGEVARRFGKAKGMDSVGYQWMRKPPGRGGSEAEEVGNSLGVQRGIRSFNASNHNNPIEVYRARGYDGTPKTSVVMRKADIIRLKGYILRAATGPGRRGRAKQAATPFEILERVEL